MGIEKILSKQSYQENTILTVRNKKMNSEQFAYWMIISERQALALEKIALLLERQLPRQPAPNYEATLEEFLRFKWATIGARVENRDKYGATIVSRDGKIYQRRSPDNAYGAVIYFSRCIGKDENGNNEYERLITFKPAKSYEVQPISRKAEDLIK